ncbi:MAG: lysine exporter LysO family protein [Eubacterium sp.]|nr:lysine exporter LysO family protein [Eubacterium sp.]
MFDMVLYLISAAIGYLIGSRMRDKKDKLTWTGKFQTGAIFFLVFSMGSRMGANEEVISGLATIGISALTITLVVLACSIASLSIGRRLMGLDRFGRIGGSGEAGAGQAEKVRGGFNKTTLLIVIAAALGMAFGHFFAGKLFPDFETFSAIAGTVIRAGLCVLLLFLGIDLGLDGTGGSQVLKVGFRVFLFPVFIAIGTLAGAALCALFLPFSLREMLAIGAGFGWYSMAPGIILDAGYATASAVSFLHNVLRELLAIILIPTIADHVGYAETVALPGAAAMDVCLPIVERATNSNVAVYSFVSGVVLSFAVPILVPLIVG